MMSDREGATDRSLEEIIREEDFRLLLEARARPFFQLLNLLRSRPDLKLNKKLLWKLREETHAVETFLDDFGARNNKTFSYFTEIVASVRNFAHALFDMHHILRRYHRYRLLDDAAWTRRILEDTQETERCCRQHLLALMADGERDARDFLRLDLPGVSLDERQFTDPLPTVTLPQNVDEGEITDEPAKVGEIATKFIRAVENWKAFRFKPLQTEAELRRFVLTRYDEELARKAEGVIHNLQAKYDTYIKGTTAETEDPDLPRLRGHISMAVHLLGVARDLVHFYERHENDIRFEPSKQAIATIVSKQQVLDRIVNYALFHAGSYLERAEPLARELVKRYVQESERTFELRDGLNLHARPATLISRIVNHYGMPVQMIMDGKSCDARSITGILLLSGTHVDARDVTFRGDRKPLRDLELLFEHDMGGDDLGKLPEELTYLRDRRPARGGTREAGMLGRYLTAALTVAILAACGGVPRASETQRIADTTQILASAPAESFYGTLLSERTRELASFGDLLDDARAARIVYVGETHDNPVHHEMEARVVRALWAEDPRLAIGMEMFFRPYQSALDAYVAGEIDEGELLRRTEYFDRWSFDWEYYAPVLRFAREKRIPVVALNIPKEITRKVARGGLDSLTEEERASLPELDLTNETHRAFVREMFGTGHQLPPQMFEGFYAAMCIWDEGMAESAVRFLRSPEGADRRMVVLVGAGHVRMRFGIPDRVERRTGWPQLVAVPLELAPGETGRDWEAVVSGDEGDYLYVTPPSPRTVPARLGVGVETENPPAKGIGIAQASPGGPAAAAGVRVGDVLLSLDGKTLSDLTSLRLVLDSLPRGRSVRLVLRRGEEIVTTAVLIPGKPPHPPARP